MRKIAQVTIELRNLLKTNFELFDFDYDFDDKNFAKELEQAVIDFYYDYEIGRETPDSFKRMFKRRWLQAMSYYNKLHNTTLLEYNPLINYSMSEVMEQLRQTNSKQDNEATTTSDATTNSTSNTTGTNNNTRTDDLTTNIESSDTMSDYPQQPIGNGDYLSGQQLSDSQTKNTGTVQDSGTTNNETTDESNLLDNTQTEGTTTTTGTDNSNYEKTIEGLTGKSYQELIELERKNLIRITGMVIDEMKPCFILVY